MTPDELKEWRDTHELNQQDLADLLGVYFMTISRWERGIQKIPPFLGLALQQLHTNLTAKPHLKLVDRK